MQSTRVQILNHSSYCNQSKQLENQCSEMMMETAFPLDVSMGVLNNSSGETYSLRSVSDIGTCCPLSKCLSVALKSDESSLSTQFGVIRRSSFVIQTIIFSLLVINHRL